MSLLCRYLATNFVGIFLATSVVSISFAGEIPCDQSYTSIYSVGVQPHYDINEAITYQKTLYAKLIQTTDNESFMQLALCSKEGFVIREYGDESDGTFRLPNYEIRGLNAYNGNYDEIFGISLDSEVGRYDDLPPVARRSYDQSPQFVIWGYDHHIGGVKTIHGVTKESKRLVYRILYSPVPDEGKYTLGSSASLPVQVFLPNEEKIESIKFLHLTSHGVVIEINYSSIPPRKYEVTKVRSGYDRYFVLSNVTLREIFD